MVRVIVVDVTDGRVAGASVLKHVAQHSQSWLGTSSRACRDAIGAADVSPQQIVGVGVACAGCAMPCEADGTRLSLTSPRKDAPLARPGAARDGAAVRLVPGEKAGTLADTCAELFGLRPGIPV